MDESIGIAVVEHLRNSGYDVLAVAEIMRQADDPDILTLGLNEDRILITNDKDFGELVFRSGKRHRGVLLLRLHDESSTNRVRVVKSVLERHADRLPNHFVVATENRYASGPLRRTTSSHQLLMNDFVICIINDSNPASLILGKVYRALPDAEAESHHMLRVIDEDRSEPDGYLYPASMFVSIELPEVAERVLMTVGST